MHRWIARTIAALGFMVTASYALAQYPTKPITLIVPFPPATTTDLVARILADEMSVAMGQPVVVQNRPGANTAIGTAAVTAAAPDGYTLLMAGGATATLPAMTKSLPYDTLRDLTPISLLGRFPVFLYVNSEVPVRTLPELIEYARANPGKLNLATGNASGIVAGAQMMALAGGVKMVHVAYKGEPAAVLDLVANRVQVMFSTPSSAGDFAKSGKLRALATTLPQRTRSAPDLPSMNEYFPTFAVNAWTGLMGPRDMPREVVDRLSREVIAAFSRPQAREKLDRVHQVGAGSTPGEFNDFFRQQVELYSRVLREAGVQPE
jgi:tripartite-type tricarboxylate transporter receptor subunit TctC